MSQVPDPFKEARAKCPVMHTEFQGEKVPMILRLKDVRDAARDWETYSSDAPMRVPFPSEEDVRTVRQYPLEVDPPEHGDYRKLVEPFFLRPKQPEMKAKITALIGRLVDDAIERGSTEIVREFAIPLQSHALTYLLNVDEKEAETWIGWGVHVFKEGDGKSKGSFMEDYCQQMFERAEANPGDDFFSALNAAEFQGRKLSLEEKLGYANIAFAGGRDTIIHAVANTIAHFGGNPSDLDYVRKNPDKIVTAGEEMFRAYMPLTHIGRVCPRDTDVHGVAVKAGERVSLGWASANRDAEAFVDPDDVKMDRKPNPHISFGYGPHLCLGAHHARAIMRQLIKTLTERVAEIRILESEDNVEREVDYDRKVGYHTLQVELVSR